jgi:formamidopyrimidine-DNA glycosylase
MPELPEVETVRRGLQAHLVGRRIDGLRVRKRTLRFPVNSGRLRTLAVGATVRDVRRRGKYLLTDIGDQGVLLIHLGMTGRLSFAPGGTPYETHDHVAFLLDDGRELRFNDPRRFGMVLAMSADEETDHPRLRDLGLEPLGPGFTAETLRVRAAGSRRPIKSLIMDAHWIVGIGNIYASEALFRARVHPEARAGRLSLARWQRLVAAIRTTLEAAIEEGGTTLRDFAGATGEAGYFAVQLQVYGREGERCRCGAIIRRAVHSGRSTFYCPRCQRR